MKKQEQFVLVPVPADKVLAVYRFLGTEPPAEPMADPAVIKKAYEESSPDTKRFLDLLAAHPDEWLTIGEVRDELGLGVHELAGVLSTLPRRWRNRYHQTAPMPYEVEGKGSQRRYMMGREVATLVAGQAS